MHDLELDSGPEKTIAVKYCDHWQISKKNALVKKFCQY